MAEPPPESSHPPPGTPLIDSSRSYGDSMEDPDPQATRKRPRLDSGTRVGESLSIDARATPPAAPASDMDVTPDSARPSKVTINVKSPFIDMTAEPENASFTQSQNPHSPATTPQPSTTDNTDMTPSNVISIASSPTQSPEIEVAELEDMDQDPNTSSWRPLGEALRGHAVSDVVEVDDSDDPLALIDHFPIMYEGQSAEENLQRIIIMIEKRKLSLSSPAWWV
ncbi:ubiquitin C-terminal hydrolase [Penicillium longicatenatum]|uniref:ubiquitin C-terminal hydrolase n=1 Tax=Penicillium longicatenatum TaxID=1561947 RepID=UPI0025493619|nr:ubiquitin C-terminal hydrolase [Penicillium longicatenatum]KAJ5630629.1 ubiquitin C-terminal hydrolase [Penicillium longicatenatum]